MLSACIWVKTIPRSPDKLLNSGVLCHWLICYCVTYTLKRWMCCMQSKPIFLEPDEIKQLAKKHLNGNYNVIDAALIAFSGMSFLSLLDLSLIQVKDLITERGAVYKQTTIPAIYNPNGKQKVLIISNKSFLLEITEAVVEWRIKSELGLSNLGTFRGLNPESRFFLDNRGDEFPITPRAKGNNDIARMQPTRLRRHFDRFLLPVGVTPQGLNRSFLLNFYNESIKDGMPTMTIKSLVALTGLGVDTIRRHVNREPRSIKEVLETMY